MTRPETRYKVNLPVFLTWQDRQGVVRRASGRCINLSASGAQVETIDSLTPQSRVLVHSEGFGRLGNAVVRYCRRSGMKYSVGLQFTALLVLSDGLRKEIVDLASATPAARAAG